MIQGLYNSAAAADGLHAWNDAIARNIAAAGTPGFKKEAVSFDGIALGTSTFGSNPSKALEMAAVAPTPRTAVSFRAGDMRRTGDPHEFAIEGTGFFRLQRPDGESVYTRDGQFRVSTDGQLTSKQGFPVVGDGGPIQLLIDGGPVSIDVDGRVMQGDQEVGVLTVYDFADTSALHRAVGGFVLDPNRPQAPQVAAGSRVHQGFLEQSNVSAVREMVDLITVNNALQANQKVIQSLDGIMERSIQALTSA
jgi:flagellar basal-body rod protein FlgF